MTALLQARSNVQRYGAGSYPNQFYGPQKGATKIWEGALVVFNAGYMAPGSTATGLVAAGVAKDTYDNLSGGDGGKTVTVDAGVFPFANSAAGDAIAQADVGNDCYIVDDQTVAKTSATNTRSRAGKIVMVDSAGVWVLVGIGH